MKNLQVDITLQTRFDSEFGRGPVEMEQIMQSPFLFSHPNIAQRISTFFFKMISFHHEGIK
jgi:hypothetical protein